MGDLLYMVGESFNLLGTQISGSDPGSFSPGEDTNFAAANCWDGRMSRPGRFSVTTSPVRLDVDFGSAQTVSMVALLGHNLDSGVVVTVRKSNDNFVGDDNLVATFTHRRCSMYASFADNSERYWRVIFTGTNAAGAIQIGEIVMGDYTTSTIQNRHDMSLDAVSDQVRSVTPLGEEHRFQLGNCERHTIELNFAASYTALQVARDTLWAGSSFGTDPVLIVPNDDRPDVFFGHFTEELPIRRIHATATEGSTFYEWTLVLRESGYPSAIADAATITAAPISGPSNQFLDQFIASGTLDTLTGSNTTWKLHSISPGASDLNLRFDGIAGKNWTSIEGWLLSSGSTNNQESISFTTTAIAGVADGENWNQTPTTLSTETWTPPQSQTVVKKITWTGVTGMTAGEAFNITFTTEGQSPSFNDVVYLVGLNLV
jgi:hypothetical protein